MKTNVQSISNQRDIIKRKKTLKKELKLKILKSIIQNKSIKRSFRSFLNLKRNFIWKKNFSKANQQNICVISGKKKTTFKLSSMSRQYTKKLVEHGMIQNIKNK